MPNQKKDKEIPELGKEIVPSRQQPETTKKKVTCTFTRAAEPEVPDEGNQQEEYGQDEYTYQQLFWPAFYALKISPSATRIPCALFKECLPQQTTHPMWGTWRLLCPTSCTSEIGSTMTTATTMT